MMIHKISEEASTTANHCVFLYLCHYLPISEKAFKWRFVDGPIVSRDCMLATVLLAKSDSDVMFYLQIYQGLIIYRSIVY